MEVKRRKFQGVLNILSFNRHFYYAGLGIIALIFASRFLIDWSETLFWIIIAAFATGLIMPLIVSAYVYDFSNYYQMDWLKKIIRDDKDIRKVANINAGFDETSFLIKEKLPGSELHVFDFYNAHQH